MKKLVSILLALAVVSILAAGAWANSNNLTIVSDTSVQVYGPLTAYAPLGDAAWGTSKSAMETYLHPSWPWQTDPDAKWISTSYYIGDADDSGPIATSTWRWFTKSVDLCAGAYNIQGIVTATSDNAEVVYVNGIEVGFDGEVQDPWADNSEWATINDYPFTAVPADTLTLDFIVRNYPGNNSPTANPTGLIFKATVTYDCPIHVAIDIKPGSDPNCFNNDGHGAIPVAILGSAEFDVSKIDPSTVQLEGMAVKVVGKGDKLLAHIEDVNGDGVDDLVVQIQDLDGSFASGSGTAQVTGMWDGIPFEGSDSICVVP